jgi:F-type H+-transporting ATPase subunit gamma
MPSLKDIRRRIGSVKSTQKITRAMKLVSAAKFARANAAVVAARPYGKAFDDMVARLITAAGDDIDSPWLTEKPEKKALVVVLATDRGFCGGMNSNLFKATLNFIGEKRKAGVEIDLVTWGKRARLFGDKAKLKSLGAREKVLEKPNYETARLLSEELGKHYSEAGYDRVYIAFVEFQSAMSQSPKVKQILPIVRAKADATDQNVIIEPSVKELLPGLLKRQMASVVFRAMLEGAASEHGARMTAMDSATNNANEVLRGMKIEYNRARQAAITKELIEITSGAQAL